MLAFAVAAAAVPGQIADITPAPHRGFAAIAIIVLVVLGLGVANASSARSGARATLAIVLVLPLVALVLAWVIHRGRVAAQATLVRDIVDTLAASMCAAPSSHVVTGGSQPLPSVRPARSVAPEIALKAAESAPRRKRVSRPLLELVE